MTPCRPCQRCSQPLVRRERETSSQWAKRKFCSRSCFRLSLADRAPSRTNPGVYAKYLVDAATGCWLWQGYFDRNGYGRLYDPTLPRSKRISWAHRAFYEKFKGAVPDGHEVDHLCSTPACVNPEHLEPVTRAEHARRTFQRLGFDDKHRLAGALRASGMTYSDIAKALEYSCLSSAAGAVKRAVEKGLVDPTALPDPPRLTDDERSDIRALYAAGIPQTDLAAWYGVDSSFISRICARLDSRAARREAGLA